MSVTTPDGRYQDLNAPESSVARLTCLAVAQCARRHRFPRVLGPPTPTSLRFGINELRTVVTVISDGRYKSPNPRGDHSRRCCGHERRPPCGFQNESRGQGRRDKVSAPSGDDLVESFDSRTDRHSVGESSARATETWIAGDVIAASLVRRGLKGDPPLGDLDALRARRRRDREHEDRRGAESGHVHVHLRPH